MQDLEKQEVRYYAKCLFCGSLVEIYERNVIGLYICEDCKKAIAYAKELMNKEKGNESNNL